ncbi:MAG: hypothetical protein M3Z29_04575 [Pseudomonadota bacterium]|nr:hypothetical protein [Pseudomonadota bacterium]
MNLLLVDEFPQMLPSLRRAVRELGIEISVTAVTTTAAARSELHRGTSFDLVLLDVVKMDTLCWPSSAPLRQGCP